MTVRTWRIFAAGAWLLAGSCLAAIPLSYGLQSVLIPEKGYPGVAVGVRLASGCGHFSWRPRTPYRPDWAGQVARLGFRYTRWSDGSGEVAVPLWAPLAASCVLGWAARRGTVAAKRSRTLRGTCPDCNYDLRASADRCPECGRPMGTP